MKKGLIITLSVVFLFLIYSLLDYAWLANRQSPLSYNTSHITVTDSDLYGKNSDYYQYKSTKVENYPVMTDVVIPGSQYDTMVGNQQILNSYEGIPNVLLTEEAGSVTYEFSVSESGFYHVLVQYYPYEGKSSNIERKIFINDVVPFKGLENIVFHRVWEIGRAHV